MNRSALQMRLLLTALFFLTFLMAQVAAADEFRCVLPQNLAGVSSDGLTKEECEKVSAEIMRQVGISVEPMNKPGGSAVSSQTAKPAIEVAPSAPEEGSQTSQGSLFDKYISATQKWHVQASLKPFGYEIFSGAGAATPQNLPVSSDYIVGPGDEIHVLLWGRLTGQYSLAVSRDGTIHFPNIGPLPVAGMTFEKMKSFLTRQVRSIVGTETSVTMGRLRSIHVLVLGEVKRPGTYEVSAMSTVTSALMASGGASGIGSLRRIDLKRGGKTAATIDLYELLTSGDKSSDARLQDEDVVFVNIVGPIVGIAGNVKRPAVYELKDSTDLASVLELAGGTIPMAYTQRIQIERIQDNQTKVVLDINASEVATARSAMLLDGDLVKVFPVVEKESNAVYLEGHIKRPGKYELKKAMRIKDIVRDEKDLLDETALDYALVKRFLPLTMEVALIPFNLGALLSGSEKDNIELLPGDSIHVFSKWSFRDRAAVSISGEVRCEKSQNEKYAEGCSFELENGMTVTDLVYKAGGLTTDASLEWFELYRTNRQTKEVALHKLNLEKALSKVDTDNIKLEDMDRVVIHSAWEKAPKSYITVYGAVNRPGRYPYASNMTVRDMIFAAGGTHESAYLKDAELAVGTVSDDKNYIFDYRKISLLRALAGDPEHNLPVPSYSSLFVKQISYWQQEMFVELKGEFANQGRYRIKKGEKLSSVIERAGGFTPNAYLKGSIFTRESVMVLQQRNLDESVARFEQALLSSSALATDKAITPEDAKQIQYSTEHKKALIARLKASKAEGRISIKLQEQGVAGSPSDIELDDKDVLTVPSKPTQVQVIGSVFNQTAFLYTHDTTVADYLKKAGGTMDSADEEAMFVLKVDGTAVSKKESRGLSWDTGSRSWLGNSFMYAKLDPGDTIVVPEKIESIHWLREVKDLTQILYQIAVTAGVLIVAF